MKKLLVCAALFVCAMSVNAQDRSNAVKVNLFSPLVKTGSFFYERKLNDKSSAQLGVGFTSFGKDVKISGMFFTPEYRYYLSNEALNGFYVGPYARYQNLTIEDKLSTEPSKATLTTFGGGVVVGRQWLFGERITFDSFIGPNYNVGDVKVEQGGEPESIPGSFKGFGVRFGVTLGVAF